VFPSTHFSASTGQSTEWLLGLHVAGGIGAVDFQLSPAGCGDCEAPVLPDGLTLTASQVLALVAGVPTTPATSTTRVTARDRCLDRFGMQRARSQDVTFTILQRP
jgi:hypothetical protein